MSAADVLEKLGKNLRIASHVALANLRPGDALQMVHERNLLEYWLGAVLEREESSGDQVIDALERFRKGSVLKNMRQARLVCYGLLQPFGQPQQRLIDDAELFPLLLKHLDHHRHHVRQYRKCYRGLLNCYFSFDPDSAGADHIAWRNRETLRDYLYERRDSLRLESHNPQWVTALSRHPALFTADPFREYRLDKLQGDWSPLEEIQQDLEIGEDSWFIRDFVLKQVEVATKLDDASLREHLDHLLLLLGDHPLYASTGLKKLLNSLGRYSTADESAVLRDFAVNLWGNPWLPATAQNWQCDAAARDMVALWLKRHLLREFFSIFADDVAGPRRLDFWELYCSDMQGMYFAMGQDAFDPAKLNYFRFRNVAKGLVVKLTEGTRDLHAFIMQFGRHHVVEFSRNNNVAYFYDTRNGPPPFYFSEGWIKVGALSVGNVLKGEHGKPVSQPLPHQDNGRNGWETRFAQEMGATPGAVATFCAKYHCRHEDLRGEGGYQWIRPGNKSKCTATAAAVLLGWGFVWSVEESGYFRAGGV